jgi:chromate transporter
VSLPVLFWLFLKASLFSTGGTGNLPSLYADLTVRRWAAQRQFAEALAIGQIAPGPSGLWVISLGYFVRGVPGALAALGGIVLPPLLVVAVDRLSRRMRDAAMLERFVGGVSLGVVGIFATVLVRLLADSDAGVRGLVIAVIAMGLGTMRRVPVPAVLAMGAVAGVLFIR